MAPLLPFKKFFCKPLPTLRLSLSLALLLAVSASLTMFPNASRAQDNILRIVVPYPPGGSSDRAARLLADALQSKLGMSVIVENITGAGGRVALQQIRRMPADSNLMVLVNPALMVVAPLVFKDLGHDPETDFQPVSQISSYEMAAAVGAAVPVRELSHLLAWEGQSGEDQHRSTCHGKCDPMPGVDDNTLRAMLAQYITHGVSIGTQGQQMQDFMNDFTHFFRSSLLD